MTDYKILPDGSPSRLSINSLYMVGLPTMFGMEQWNGKQGKEIYSKEVLKQQIEKCFHVKFKIEEAYIAYVNRLLDTTSAWNGAFVCWLSELALGLFSILYLLKKQPIEFVGKNNMREQDCVFWKSCNMVVLCAVFLRGQVGQFITKEINEYVLKTGLQPIRVMCAGSDVTPSLMGCCRAAAMHSQVFTYDFGSTRVKRGFTFRGESALRELDAIYLSERDFETGETLHEKIHRIIVHDINRLALGRGRDLAVSMCLANNIMYGEILDRGRYGVLKTLGGSYRLFLQDALQRILHRELPVYMMNDAEAVAILYAHFAPMAAVFTFGTAIGVGYAPVLEKENLKC